jgi:23S rRNA (uracil1939-C5)-methyltransferase
MAKKKKLSDKRKLRDFFVGAVAEARTVAAACPHFGECGGCEFQDVPYEKQLDAKLAAFDFIADCVKGDFRERADVLAGDEAEAAEKLRRRAELLDSALGRLHVDIVPSPIQLGYRQRMDYVFAFGQAGLRRANRHRQVVNLDACPLLGEQGFWVFQKALRLAREAGLPDYDYMRHTGDLRYFVVRRSRNGQVLLSLVTKTLERRDAVLSVLRTLVEEGDIASGYWLLAPGLGDVSFGEIQAVVGAEWIEEEMNSVRLRIGANTFFQSNPVVAEKAYASIAGFVPAGGRVLDMYSGVGSIAANIARSAGAVTAVENVPENVALAEGNIAANCLGNVQLLVDDSARYLLELAANPDAPRPDMVVVNPPRPGVEGGGMRALKQLAPGRIAYLSCNPFTLLRNLAEILDEYAVRSLDVYDMFPQTRHFESLALLEKK